MAKTKETAVTTSNETASATVETPKAKRHKSNVTVMISRENIEKLLAEGIEELPIARKFLLAREERLRKEKNEFTF